MEGLDKEGMNFAANGWFTEVSSLWPGQGLSLKVKEVLFREKSDFQDICVFDSESIFGRVLTLDGIIQCTSFDEFSYQEMITHVPLCALPTPAKVVLVIGGGDGGVVREITKHDSVEEIHMAEIDPMVPEVSKKYFPQLASGFADPRLRLKFCDGVQFMQEAEEGTYDCIIIDSSDPAGPAEVLFQKPFFTQMHRALKPGGAICTQAESLWLHMPIIESLAAMAAEVFVDGSVHYCYTTVPTYPSGQIGFVVCAKASQSGGTPALDMREPRQSVNPELLKYYSPEMHRAAFVLPAFAKKALSPSLTYQRAE